MIIRAIKNSLVYSALALSTLSAHADSVKDARHFIVAAYQAIDTATAHKDSKTLLSQLAPNYQMLNIKGQRLTRSDVSRHMQMWFSRTTELKTHTSVINVSVSNNKIVVVAKEFGKAFGINSRTKKRITIISNSSFQDSWIKIHGRWLRQNTKTLRQQMTVDGKPLKF